MSHHARSLVLVLGGATAGAVLMHQLMRRSHRRDGRAAATTADDLPGDTNRENEETRKPLALPPPEVEEEFFSRSKAFFDEAGHEAVRGAFVVVVGLGGVGSHAAHMLCRAGVRSLRVIDLDQVAPRYHPLPRARGCGSG